jgi:hypothetical protein
MCFVVHALERALAHGYPRKDGAGDTTINSAYEVDPAQNAGHDFAFDEVVRNREERRRLPASDCEQCRAVGVILL